MKGVLVMKRNRSRLIAAVLAFAVMAGPFSCRAFAEEIPAPGPAEAESRKALTPEEILSQMTVEQKIAQMIMPDFRYYRDEAGEKQNLTEMREDVEQVLKDYGFAGVIFFGTNLADTEKAVRLIDAMQAANASVPGRPQLLTAVDQEGGPVVRLGHGLQMTGNMALGAVGDPSAAEQAGQPESRESVEKIIRDACQNDDRCVS